ncbi:hypothetical protein [Chakrabartyella piscis]|uniref:hypothetical protein n=1 Tax=Chakrabartyella piscis TaxID=2918914 RepID=UPI002958CE50|nr:hypothetical protein [Chakrabartyella piscis]
MEWERVKYMVIFILVALNIGLFGLRFQQGQENILSGTQERAVFEVLSRNGITLYTDLDTTASPMSRLLATVPVYEKDVLEEIFFGGDETHVIVGMDETTYQTEEKTLVLSGLKGVFTNNALPETDGVLSRSEAMEVGQTAIYQMSNLFGDMQLQNIWQKGNVWGLEYVGTYHNELIFSNECTVYLTEAGVMEIDFSFAQIIERETEEKEIVFADEALIIFMRAWLELGAEEEIAVQKVNVGYYLPSNTELTEGTELYLEPHYCIATLEDNQKFFVNGYTCQIVDIPTTEEVPEEPTETQLENMLQFLETKPDLAETNAYFAMEGVLVEEEMEGTWYQYDIYDLDDDEWLYIVFCSFDGDEMEYSVLEVNAEPLVLDVEEVA